jgi:hypothetical protein
MSTLVQTDIPPPPMPANARAAIISPMVRANPHNVEPMPKTMYAKRRHCLRPNISLSFPYRGCSADSVRK